LKDASRKPPAQPLSLRHSETNALACESTTLKVSRFTSSDVRRLSDDLREKTYTPDTIKPFEGDLLDDDLPIDRQFLTVSRKGSVNSEAGMRHGEYDGITIHCNEWFELHSDGYLAGDTYLTTQAKKEYVSNISRSLHSYTKSHCVVILSHKQSIAVIAKGCNLKIDLHDGYDWESTRAHIESKRKEMREKLRSLRELLASGQQSLEGLAAFSDFAFNSIHVGLPEHADYSSPEELANAIDMELAPEDSQEGIEDAWQTLEPRARVFSPSKQAPEGLGRHARAGMEFRFIGVDIDYSVPMVPRAADLDASVEIAVATIEIVDQLPTSTWKTFLKTRPAERFAKRPRQGDPDLSRCQIKWYPSPQALGSEAIMKVNRHFFPLLPSRFTDTETYCASFTARPPSRTDACRPRRNRFLQTIRLFLGRQRICSRCIVHRSVTTGAIHP
jgi:hypothetical protein